MKLIFIYGPPASGKLTIAEKISELTKIPIFHNHATRDIVKDIYPNNLIQHYKLVDSLREQVLSYCAEHNTDLIFTFVYEGSDDDKMVELYINSIEKHGGSIHFVELVAKREDLLNRVSNESRKKHKKLINPDTLFSITESLEKYSIPFVTPLKINTSELSVDDAALKIVSSLHL